MKMARQAWTYILPVFIMWTIYLTAEANKNVLFLVADDLRPQLNAYEGPNFPSTVSPQMETPNLDQLASNSLLLTRAYVQQATCCPSRSSFLTSRRPDTTRTYNLNTKFREAGGDFTTLPQYFKEQGYESVGMGKIFHVVDASDAASADDPDSWSRAYFQPSNKNYGSGKELSSFAVPLSEIEVTPLPDMEIAANAISELQGFANTGQPFFMAVGFNRPHLPFICPENFFEYYPLENIGYPPNPYAPQNYPSIAWHNYGELRDYGDITATGDFNTTMDLAMMRQLRQAYYSCVTYIDFLVGEILTELDNLGLTDSTIVSFIGDHGWSLGENGEWTKNTNLEQSTHAPMMIRVPGVTDNGIVSDDLVEFVDLYPTLVEAADLPLMTLCPASSSNIPVCTEGSSLMPLARGDSSHSPKQYVFSQWPRNNKMGYSVRTDRLVTVGVGMGVGVLCTMVYR